jgi:fluoride exporter
VTEQGTATGKSESAYEWRGAILTIVVIGIGGVVGSTARWQISEWSAERWPSSFPWGTFLINVSGSLILGLYLTIVTERIAGRPLTRLLVATGVLGAYTTFSTFVYETVRLIQHGEPMTAVAYLAASLIAGLAACAVGISAGQAR